MKVIVEKNSEDVDRYENTTKEDTSNPKGELRLKPRSIFVSLHSPKEPADIRSKSFRIPLGQSTIVYITPKARNIDEHGKQLSESQRNLLLK